MHERIRKEFWGFSNQETLSNQDLIQERYRSIRPAPGYPACPDHSLKVDIFKLLANRDFPVSLTESFAMEPGASVCGFYFSHPQSHYFGVGNIDRDQVEAYMLRKKVDRLTAEQWLSPQLGYV